MSIVWLAGAALALGVGSLILGVVTLGLLLRSTPHALRQQVEDVFQIARRAEERADKACATGDATREHVEGVLEALEETYSRVEKKRKRAETAAARAEEAAAEPQPQRDDFDSARAFARQSGWRV